MQWSKLRSTVESRFAPALGRRVTLHQARYRYAREEVGRVWISIDGRDSASFASPNAASGDHAPADAESVRAAGTYSDSDAIAELRAFLSMPVAEALVAPSPLLRALAVLDGRVGKRRLGALAAAPDPHPLVRTLLAVRCDAEGVRVGPRAEPGETAAG